METLNIYAAQIQRDHHSPALLETHSRLGRFLAEHGHKFPYLHSGKARCPFCSATQVDNYSHTADLSAKYTGNLVGYCHACKRLSLQRVDVPASAIR